jgi:hypothetical protein
MTTMIDMIAADCAAMLVRHHRYLIHSSIYHSHRFRAVQAWGAQKASGQRQHVVLSCHRGSEKYLPSIFPLTRGCKHERTRRRERHSHGWNRRHPVPHPHSSIARLRPFGLSHSSSNAPPRLALPRLRFSSVIVRVQKV